MDDLRAQFPVLEHLAYLNAGSNGPVPERALDAVSRSLAWQATEGRGDKAHFEENAERILAYLIQEGFILDELDAPASLATSTSSAS